MDYKKEIIKLLDYANDKILKIIYEFVLHIVD